MADSLMTDHGWKRGVCGYLGSWLGQTWASGGNGTFPLVGSGSLEALKFQGTVRPVQRRQGPGLGRSLCGCV